MLVEVPMGYVQDLMFGLCVYRVDIYAYWLEQSEKKNMIIDIRQQNVCLEYSLEKKIEYKKLNGAILLKHNRNE